MKKMLLICLCFMLTNCSLFGMDLKKTDDLSEEIVKKRLGITIRTTIASRYKSVGRSKFGDEGLFGNGVTMDIGNGFSFDVSSYYPVGSGYESSKKFGYTVFYKSKFFDEEKYEIEMKAKHLFYNIINGNRYNNYQESGAKFSLTNLINFDNGDKLIPSYYPLIFWKHTGSAYNGTAHILGLDYVKNINDKYKMRIYYDLTYNDSIGNSRSTFSHSVIGIFVDIPLDENITISPFYNYQITLDENICGEDSGPYYGIVFKMKF